LLVGGPDAELAALLRFNPVSDGDNRVQIVEVDLFRLGFAFYGAMSGGCPEFPDNHLFVKLTLVEYVPDMLRDCFFAFTEQLGHMVLRQPDRLVLQSNVDPDRPVRCLIDEYFRGIHGYGRIGQVFAHWYYPLIDSRYM
jgi:hypothetical protein